FDSTLRLWDVERPDALPLVLEGHDFWVYSARFSPDGDFLVSGSGDRTIRIWTTSSALLADEICRTVERNLTAREWAEYLPADVAYEKTCPGL
ncbi:MAG: serine/threonine protein kinase, partial [FCB group bacterium]|nr:serine/threonine protein kinase [FCB group bacterium]